jgi:hypothetical protein
MRTTSHQLLIGRKILQFSVPTRFDCFASKWRSFDVLNGHIQPIACLIRKSGKWRKGIDMVCLRVDRFLHLDALMASALVNHERSDASLSNR